MKVVYIVDNIPKSTAHNRRPGLSMQAEYITIHNTANPTSNARGERAWLTNPNNDRTASYHIVVDERGAIEVIPLDEVAWHAGDGNGNGNRRSIGVEICESGDYKKTVDNAAKLVAEMLYMRGWGVDRLRRHYDWSGKICPRKMYDGGTWRGWSDFKNNVAKELANLTGRRFSDVPAEHWAAGSIEKAAEAGVISGISKTEFGVGQPVTREQLAVIFDRIGILDEKLTKEDGK